MSKKTLQLKANQRSMSTGATENIPQSSLESVEATGKPSPRSARQESTKVSTSNTKTKSQTTSNELDDEVLANLFKTTVGMLKERGKLRVGRALNAKGEAVQIRVTLDLEIWTEDLRLRGE